MLATIGWWAGAKIDRQRFHLFGQLCLMPVPLAQRLRSTADVAATRDKKASPINAKKFSVARVDNRSLAMVSTGDLRTLAPVR
jgi:hypothetical protein